MQFFPQKTVFRKLRFIHFWYYCCCCCMRLCFAPFAFVFVFLLCLFCFLCLCFAPFAFILCLFCLWFCIPPWLCIPGAGGNWLGCIWLGCPWFSGRFGTFCLPRGGGGSTGVGVTSLATGLGGRRGHNSFGGVSIGTSACASSAWIMFSISLALNFVSGPRGFANFPASAIASRSSFANPLLSWLTKSGSVILAIFESAASIAERVDCTTATGTNAPAEAAKASASKRFFSVSVWFLARSCMNSLSSALLNIKHFKLGTHKSWDDTCETIFCIMAMVGNSPPKDHGVFLKVQHQKQEFPEMKGER